VKDWPQGWMKEQAEEARAAHSLREAAPDLLEACEAAGEYLQSNVPSDGWGMRDRGADADREAALKVVRAAIAKARGES
jgi:hypothetical protein